MNTPVQLLMMTLQQLHILFLAQQGRQLFAKSLPPTFWTSSSETAMEDGSPHNRGGQTTGGFFCLGKSGNGNSRMILTGSILATRINQGTSLARRGG